MHLPVEAYTKDDELMPCWTTPGGVRVPHCPRCEAQVEMETERCPASGQRMGGYVGYSAPQWPRKQDWRPDLPDDYSFYFIASTSGSSVCCPSGAGTASSLSIGSRSIADRSSLTLNRSRKIRLGARPRWT